MPGSGTLAIVIGANRGSGEAALLRGHDEAAMATLLMLVSVARLPAIDGSCASKAGPWCLVHSPSAELASDGVGVHGVYPGAEDADTSLAFGVPETDPSEVAAAILSGVTDGTDVVARRPLARQHGASSGTIPGR